MKRSKMLQIITELIYMDDHFDEEDIKDAEDIAWDILYSIERNGMMPPSNGVYNRGHPSSLYTYDPYCGGNYDDIDLEDICYWEDEKEMLTKPSK